MSPVLSKQTGSKPSSKQHLMELSPLTPAPITAILFGVMVSGDLPPCSDRDSFYRRDDKRQEAHNSSASFKADLGQRMQMAWLSQGKPEHGNKLLARFGQTENLPGSELRALVCSVVSVTAA